MRKHEKKISISFPNFPMIFVSVGVLVPFSYHTVPSGNYWKLHKDGGYMNRQGECERTSILAIFHPKFSCFRAENTMWHNNITCPYSKWLKIGLRITWYNKFYNIWSKPIHIWSAAFCTQLSVDNISYIQSLIVSWSQSNK